MNNTSLLNIIKIINSIMDTNLLENQTDSPKRTSTPNKNRCKFPNERKFNKLYSKRSNRILSRGVNKRDNFNKLE